MALALIFQEGNPWGNQTVESSHLFPFTQTELHHQIGSFLSFSPLLILLSLITCVYLLTLMGNSAGGLIFGAGMLWKDEASDIYYLISSVMERKLHSISIISILEEHLQNKMPVNTCSQNLWFDRQGSVEKLTGT